MPNNERPLYKSTDDDLDLVDDPIVSSENEVKDTRSERLKEWKSFFQNLFDFRPDKENDLDILAGVKQDSDMVGTRLWVLICAILVASLGLNTNSTAVIIGAMCISPLMGPIIGFGTALGTYDFELLKRSLRNLALTTLFSILTATIYFLVSPIKHPTEELIARTYPTVYDVMIAFFGGFAGMIAVCTKSKGQVLPGVAIATALMPPLCTAGYGIANGMFSYFMGSFYLFVINSVFIALATYFAVKLLRLPQKSFVNPAREKRVHRIIAVISVCVLAPSLYMGIKLVKESLFEQRVHTFVSEAFDFNETVVLRSEVTQLNGQKKLNVILMGNPIPQTTVDSLRRLMPKFHLNNVLLDVRQNFEGEEFDINALRTGVLQDLYQRSDEVISRQSRTIDSLTQKLKHYTSYGAMQRELIKEMKILFPEVDYAFFASTAASDAPDSTLQVVVQHAQRKTIQRKELGKMESWLKERTGSPKVKIILAE